MNATIHPARIEGMVAIPASKSVTQRALAAALLKGGTSKITNTGHSNDELAAKNILSSLGATIEEENAALRVISKGINPVSRIINCGESGLSARMFAPIAALGSQRLTLIGEGSLQTRPFFPFVDIFPQLGVFVQSNNGRLPLQLEGPLSPADITVDGSLSSQFLTGLLFAYAGYFSNSACNIPKASIYVSNAVSKPYLDLTIEVIKRFGLAVPHHIDYGQFEFVHSPRVQQHLDYNVEGDWSSAAMMAVAAATAGTIAIQGLKKDSLQADRAIIQLLEAAGATAVWNGSTVSIKSAETLEAFEFDALHHPDLVPSLVVLAAHCNGRSIIKNIHRLRHKESDRAQTLKTEFGKMNVAITISGDNMMVDGPCTINGATVSANNDHRIAMACAVAGLRATSPVTIEGAEAINKSYPDFLNHLSAMGVTVSLSK